MSKIITRDVVFKHVGENAHTRKVPYCALEDFDGDLDREINCCRSFDDNMLVKVNLWAVGTLDLPEWMTVKEFCQNSVTWGFAWNRGLDATLPEEWQRKLVRFSGAMQVACSKLLKVKTFRSEFRKSLRDQLESWLNGEGDYDSPFSDRQADCLVKSYDQTAARRADDHAYATKCYLKGVPTPAPKRKKASAK